MIMNYCRMVRAGFFAAAGFLLAAFLCSGPQSPLYASDEITVKRDKEKTTYSIGPNEKSRKEQEKDKERSWEMLNNMNIITDKRKNQPAGQ